MCLRLRKKCLTISKISKEPNFDRSRLDEWSFPAFDDDNMALTTSYTPQELDGDIALYDDSTSPGPDSPTFSFF